MIVLLDCDGVLSDFLGGLLRRFADKTGMALDPAKCTQWDIAKAYGADPIVMYGSATEPGFCASLEPLPGAKKAINLLRSRVGWTADFFVVTSPMAQSAHWLNERNWWLKNVLGVDPKRVIHADTKRIIFGDFLIDDKDTNIIEWSEQWPESTGLLWDAPYNQGAKLPPNARRVYGWNDCFGAMGVG